MEVWRECASSLEPDIVLYVIFFCGCVFGYLFARTVDFFHLVKEWISNHLF